MKATTFIGIALLAAGAMPLLAQTPDLSGTWLGQSNSAERWVLEQTGDKLHIKELDGDKVQTDFTCSLDGQECSAKEDGHPAKVMMYFNGDKLVEILERKSETVKQRLTLSSDGNTLTVETVPLSSGQRAETQVFKRQES